MKKIILFFFIGLLCVHAFSQDFQLVNSSQLISSGVEAHDNGEYNEAVEYFSGVSANDTNYMWAVAEMCNTYFAMEKYDTVLQISEEALAGRSEYDYMFYNMAGSAWDEKEQPGKALDYYNRGIERYPANQLLYFNKGVTLLGMDRQDEAIEAFKSSIDMDLYHSSGHYYLGKTLLEQGRMAAGFMSLSMFVLLENSGNRSTEALELLQGVSSDGLPEPEKTYAADELLQELELILRSGIALDNSYKTQVKQNDSYVRQLQVMCEKMPAGEGSDNFWMRNYAPYFRDLMESGYLPYHTYYVFSAYENEKVAKWLHKNRKKRDDFVQWAQGMLNTMMSEKAGKTYWYDNGELQAIGKKEGENYLDDWLFLYNTGSVSSRGHFNDKGERDGKWEWFNTDGVRNDLTYYKEGAMQDTNFQYHPNSLLRIEIPYVEGEVHGHVKEYDNTGALIYEADYEKGLQQGRERYYYLNGQLQNEYLYKDGLADSIAREYYPGGALKREFHVSEGDLDGTDTDYYENGNKKSEGDFTGGVQTGPWKWYNRDGSLQSEASFNENGSFQGENIHYYDNGRMSRYELYSNGELDGSCRYYNRDSNLLAVYEYSLGTMLSLHSYDKKGNELAKREAKEGEIAFISHFPEGMIKEEGKMVNGKKEGVWKKYFRNGQVDEEMNYKEGELNEKFYSYYKNGELFAEYEYLDGQMHGFYKSWYRNGNVNSMGWYLNGMAVGDWYGYSVNGEMQSHNYKLDNMSTGMQKYFYPDGKAHYEEYYKDDNILYMNLQNADGSLRKKINFENGSGKFGFPAPNGEIQVEGEMLNSLFNREIVHYYSPSKVYIRKGERLGTDHGVWEEYNAGGVLVEKGSYYDGEFDGEWQYYHDNGSLKRTGEYELGSKQGEWKWYYDDGSMRRTGVYVDGFREGEFPVYAPTGELMYKLFYSEGDYMAYSYLDAAGNEIRKDVPTDETADIVCYYSSGEKSLEMRIENGYIQDDHKEYYPNGRLKSHYVYADGEIHGEARNYWDNGSPKLIESWYHGTKHGETVIYRKDGSKLLTESYIYNMKHGEWIWYDKIGKETVKQFVYDYMLSR